MKKILSLLFLPLGLLSQPKAEPFQLHTSSGDLAGTLLLPEPATSATPLVLIIAGSGPTDRDGNNPMGVKAASYKLLAEGLALHGIASLRYDKRGIAASQSAGLKEEALRFDTYIQDAKAWLDTLKQSGRFGKLVVAGHSEGSLIGMVAASSPVASGYISLAGIGQNISEVLKAQLANLPDTLKNNAYNSLDKLRKGETITNPHPMLLSLFRPSVQPYMISWMRYSPTDEIAKLKIPVLLVQGGHDIQVAATEVNLLKQATPNAKILLLNDMNHVLKDAPAEQNANMATYTNSALPLSPGLVDAIEKFVKQL